MMSQYRRVFYPWVVFCVFLTISCVFVLWHRAVWAKHGAIVATIDKLQATSSLESYRATGEELVAQLNEAGYKESQVAVEKNLAEVKELPSTEAFAKFRETATPHECPCRLTGALISFTAGVVFLVQTTKRRRTNSFVSHSDEDE